MGRATKINEKENYARSRLDGSPLKVNDMKVEIKNSNTRAVIKPGNVFTDCFLDISYAITKPTTDTRRPEAERTTKTDE